MPLSGTGAAGGGCIQPEDESQGSTHGAWPRQTVPAEQPKLLPPRQKELQKGGLRGALGDGAMTRSSGITRSCSEAAKLPTRPLSAQMAGCPQADSEASPRRPGLHVS
jgi:hypothetical protein